VDGLIPADELLNEFLDSAVCDPDTHMIGGTTLGREVFSGVAERVPLKQGAAEEHDALPDDHWTLGLQDMNVARAFTAPELAQIKCVWRERVMVAGQKVDRHRDLCHRVERAAKGVRPEAVVFEDIASNDDEFGL
jgi:hypothetical protein